MAILYRLVTSFAFIILIPAVLVVKGQINGHGIPNVAATVDVRQQPQPWNRIPVTSRDSARVLRFHRQRGNQNKRGGGKETTTTRTTGERRNNRGRMMMMQNNNNNNRDEMGGRRGMRRKDKPDEEEEEESRRKGRRMGIGMMRRRKPRDSVESAEGTPPDDDEKEEDNEKNESSKHTPDDDGDTPDSSDEGEGEGVSTSSTKMSASKSSEKASTKSASERAPSSKSASRSASSKRKSSGKKGNKSSKSGMEEQGIRVTVAAYYLGYDVPGLLEKPTENQLSALVEVTTEFWDEFLSNYFSGTDSENVSFEGVELQIEEDFFIESAPEGNRRKLQIEEGYNYRIDFVTILAFALGSETPPSSQEAYSIMSSADLNDYVERFVKNQPAFSSVMGVGFRPQEPSGPPILSVSLFFVMEYRVPALMAEPKMDEVVDLVDVTGDFWDQYLADYFDEAGFLYVGFELVALDDFLELDDFFNYRINFKATLLYDINTVFPPQSDETFSIMANAIFAQYISDYVRPLFPFESTEIVQLLPGSGTISPTQSPPPEGPGFAVEVPDFYVAFVIPGLEALPPRQSFSSLMDATYEFFLSVLSDLLRLIYVANLQDIILVPEGDYFGLGIPEDKFNYFVSFSMTAIFFGDSQFIPGPSEIFDLMTTIQLDVYLLEYVTLQPPFEQTSEVIFQPQDPAPTHAPTSAGPTESWSGAPTSDPVPEICDMYDFATNIARRQLQNEGPLCEPNVQAVALENGLGVFMLLVDAAGLADIFLCPGPFTGLIPTDAVFEALDTVYVDFLLDPANRELVREMVLYHLLPGTILATEIQPDLVKTIQGEDVFFTIEPFTVNSALILDTDIVACNGVIHVIDQVLFPPNFPEILVPSLSPSSSSSLQPSLLPVPVVSVRVLDYFLAYSIPSMDRDATGEELAALLDATEGFWDDYFNDYYEFSGIRYRGIELGANEALYGMGLPTESYNYYIAFGTTVFFESDSPQPPGSLEHFDIMASADFSGYILDYVRVIDTIDPNFFISCNEVIFRATEQTFPAPQSAPSVAPIHSNFPKSMAPTQSESSSVPQSVPFHSDFPESTTPAQSESSPVPQSAPSTAPALEPVHSEYPESTAPAQSESSSVPQSEPSTAPALAPVHSDFPESITPAQSESSSVPQLAPSTAPVVAPVHSDFPESMAPTQSELSSVPQSAPFHSDFPESMTPVQSESSSVPQLAPSTAPVVAPVHSDFPESTAPAQVGSSMAPAQFDLLIELPDFFMAFAVPALMSDPSTQEVQSLFEATQRFLDDTFIALFQSSNLEYTGLELFLFEGIYDLGYPDASFNFILDLSMVSYFASNAFSPPSGNEQFQLIKDADLETFLLNYVRTVPAFESATAVVIDSLLR